MLREIKTYKNVLGKTKLFIIIINSVIMIYNNNLL